MKTPILFLLAGLLGVPAAQAQEGIQPVSFSPKLRAGLKAGLNLATYTGGGRIGRQTGWRPGYATGALLAYPLSVRSGLQLEILYSQKGAYQANYRHNYRDPAFQSPNNTYHASLAYLDVPLLYTFGPGSSGPGLFVAVGPQLSLALAARESVRPTGEAAGRIHEETLNADPRSLTPVAAGYVAGVGYQLASGLGVELRYSGDFTNVYRGGYESASPYSGSGSKFHNGVLQLQVRFMVGQKDSPCRQVSQSRPRPAARYPEAGPAMPPPRPTYVDSLYRDPKVRRLLLLFSILSRIEFNRQPQPVYVPGPGQQPPVRNTPPPRTRQRTESDRQVGYPVAY
jgi:hypothetical protein